MSNVPARAVGLLSPWRVTSGESIRRIAHRNWRVARGRGAIEVDGLAVDDEFNINGVHPAISRILNSIDRRFGGLRIVPLPLRRAVNHDAGDGVFAEKEVRTPPEKDWRSFAIHAQKLSPSRFQGVAIQSGPSCLALLTSVFTGVATRSLSGSGS